VFNRHFRRLLQFLFLHHIVGFISQKCGNCSELSGDFVPESPTRGSAPLTRWGLLSARHPVPPPPNPGYAADFRYPSLSVSHLTRSPASAGIANRPLVFATRTTLSGHNIEYLCLNLFTLRRFNNNESSGGRQIRFCPY